MSEVISLVKSLRAGVQELCLTVCMLVLQSVVMSYVDCGNE